MTHFPNLGKQIGSAALSFFQKLTTGSFVFGCQDIQYIQEETQGDETQWERGGRRHAVKSWVAFTDKTFNLHIILQICTALGE